MNVKEEIDAGLAFVRELPGVLDFALIGSAAVDPDGEVNDIDYLVRLESTGPCAVNYANGLLDSGEGWERCGEYDTASGSWDAIRRDSLNLVLTNDPDFYERFRRAMEVCKALQLKDKDSRIAVCRIVRDGWSASACALLREGEIPF